MAPSNGNGNGRVSRWVFGIVLTVLLAVLGYLSAWQITGTQANADALAAHCLQQAKDEMAVAERLRGLETDVRWVREYLERQGRK